MTFWVAGAVVVGGLASSVIGGNAAQSAADTQANAATTTAQMQQQQQQQVRSDLAPYRDLGTSNIPGLTAAAANPLLTGTFNYGAFTAPSAADAAATPGYQFTLDQGLKAVQNSASAKGLGASGAAFKGASSYATGLADSTYGDTFNRALSTYGTNRNNALGNYTTNYGTASDNVNRLLGLVAAGGNAAAQTGQLGMQSTNSIAGTLQSGAAASAAGQVGAANAITGGVNNATSGLMLNSLLNKTPIANNTGATLYGTNATGTNGAIGGTASDPWYG